jgi:hypothetical protein
MGAATFNPVRRKVRLWAVTAVVVDLLVLAGLFTIGSLTGSQARSGIGVWVTLHEPALTFAAAVLPGPQGPHSPLPLTSYLAFGVLALGQTAVIGGMLGWIYTSSRRRGAL